MPKMGASETWGAIEAAKDAFIDWSRKPLKERSVLMRGWHNLIMANLDDLGALMTAEQGKPLTEAKGEVAYAASFIEWFAEEAERVYGERFPRRGLIGAPGRPAYVRTASTFRPAFMTPLPRNWSPQSENSKSVMALSAMFSRAR